MSRNIKYKKACWVGLFGDDDINTSTNPQYMVYPSTIKTITVSSGGTNYATGGQHKWLYHIVVVLVL